MKKKPLVVAAMSGNIFQANILKSGVMSDTRVDMTEDVLRATNEWFVTNKKMMYAHAFGEGSAYVFHTTDKEKAERIKSILLEESK